MKENPIKIVHQGRGGYVDIEGYRYGIELFPDGHFCIGFPSGNRHSKLQAHLDALTQLTYQDSKWFIENRSRRYRPTVTPEK